LAIGNSTAPRANAAIVTTLRGAGLMIDSFVAYHVACGFDRLFLFFDDPGDPDFVRFSAHPGVTAVACNAALKQQWMGLPEYEALSPFITSEVMVRQALNAALAMAWARQEGLGWLLHIDIDELFILPRQSVAQHFAVCDDRAPDAIRYMNFEALPERIDIKDPFREVDLFKIPTALNPGPDFSEGLDLLRETPQLPKRRFHLYSNGKSAVRLTSPDMRPMGVHGFVHRTAPAPSLVSEEGFILHYPNCGFEAFCRKYEMLGRFADKWMGDTDIVSAIGPFHLEARDVVASGDREAALAFYRQRVAMEDAQKVERLIAYRVLRRIQRPRKMLEKIAALASSADLRI
jgi:hypothetical protein